MEVMSNGESGDSLTLSCYQTANSENVEILGFFFYFFDNPLLAISNPFSDLKCNTILLSMVGRIVLAFVVVLPKHQWKDTHPALFPSPLKYQAVNVLLMNDATEELVHVFPVQSIRAEKQKTSGSNI